MGKGLKRGSAKELAELIGITERRVNQLVGEQVLQREIEGDFILPEAINCYFENKYTDKNQLVFIEEKAKHESTKRQLAEIELAERKKQMHDADDVDQVMTDMLTNFRSKLLILPTKVASILENKPKDFIYAHLSTQINNYLHELSDYTPNMFDGVATDDEEEDY